MPYSDSRYADGLYYRAQDPRFLVPQISVDRIFPTKDISYRYYVWTENDRIDNVAYNLYGSEHSWWQIMDANPEITDPNNIAPGTTIRIPNA